MSKGAKGLREGFTTGTAATAAAMAALELLLAGTPPDSVRTPLPPFAEHPGHGQEPAGWMNIPVLEAALLDGAAIDDEAAAHATPRAAGAGAPVFPAARAVVRKDGGDDPDATHEARIVATVYLCPREACGAQADGAASAVAPAVPLAPVPSTPVSAPDSAPQAAPCIRLDGGAGVGRVTLPGLPVPVGAAAINPVPRAQICHGLRHVAARCGYTEGLHAVISVPDGAALARHTFNPRLGILGGISILGTQGTVRPYSHEAWKATILQGMDVAVATGCATLCLSTGRRSEKLLLACYPELPPQAAIQVADFAEFSLQEAARRPFAHLAWACFFGKLVKLAQGHACTHAHEATLDFDLLARWCAAAGSARAAELARCVTAGHALDILLEEGAPGRAAIHAVALRAAEVARAFAGRPVRIHLFHMNGTELVRV